MNHDHGAQMSVPGSRDAVDDLAQVGLTCHTRALIVRIRLSDVPTFPVRTYPVGERTIGMPVGAYWAFGTDVSRRPSRRLLRVANLGKFDAFRAFVAGYSGCQAKILNGKCR